MPKHIKIYHRSKVVCLHITASVNLPRSLRQKFGLQATDPLTLTGFDPVSGNENDTFEIDEGWYDRIIDDGHYTCGGKEKYRLSFRSFPTSPFTAITLNDLSLSNVKGALLEAYGFDQNTSCEIREEVIIPGHAEPVLTEPISTTEDLQRAAKGRLRIIIDYNAPVVSGPEVGVRNVVELAAKLLFCYGTVGTTNRTARNPIAVIDVIRDMLEGNGVQVESRWVMAMIKELPELAKTEIWDEMKATYRRTSQQVAHTSYYTNLPIWEDLKPMEAIELFSPVRKTVQEQHYEHVRLSIEIVRYMEKRGLNANLVLAAYFLKSFRADASSPELIYEITERGPQYLPFESLDRSLKDLYIAFIEGGQGADEQRIQKWAKFQMSKVYTSVMPKWG